MPNYVVAVRAFGCLLVQKESLKRPLCLYFIEDVPYVTADMTVRQLTKTTERCKAWFLDRLMLETVRLTSNLTWGDYGARQANSSGRRNVATKNGCGKKVAY